MPYCPKHDRDFGLHDNCPECMPSGCMGFIPGLLTVLKWTNQNKAPRPLGREGFAKTQRSKKLTYSGLAFRLIK